jgi:hypothetical protein
MNHPRIGVGFTRDAYNDRLPALVGMAVRDCPTGQKRFCF